MVYDPNKDGSIWEYLEKKKDAYRKFFAEQEKDPEKIRLSYEEEWNQFFIDHGLDKRI
jgi:3-methyladenine DNA glycosylase Tag